MRKQADRGFTLVEIMVVVAILGMLATIVATNVMGHIDEARRQTARTDVDQISQAVEIYYVRKLRLPTMQELVDPPPILKGHTVAPRDPWKRPYEIREGDRPGSYEIRSWGPDGLQGTEDDISSLGLKDR